MNELHLGAFLAAEFASILECLRFKAIGRHQKAVALTRHGVHAIVARNNAGGGRSAASKDCCCNDNYFLHDIPRFPGMVACRFA